MAFTTPRTWVTGELVTSSIMNIHIRDNLNATNSYPGAMIYKSGNQSLPGSQAATWVSITSWTTEFDSDTMLSTANRLTCKTAGKYLLGGQAHFDASSSTGSVRRLRVLWNGANAVVESGPTPPANTTITQRVSLASRMMPLAVNDYLELQGAHDATGALNILAGYEVTFFWAKRLSD